MQKLKDRKYFSKERWEQWFRRGGTLRRTRRMYCIFTIQSKHSHSFRHTYITLTPKYMLKSAHSVITGEDVLLYGYVACLGSWHSPQWLWVTGWVSSHRKSYYDKHQETMFLNSGATLLTLSASSSTTGTCDHVSH